MGCQICHQTIRWCICSKKTRYHLLFSTPWWHQWSVLETGHDILWGQQFCQPQERQRVLHRDHWESILSAGCTRWSPYYLMYLHSGIGFTMGIPLGTGDNPYLYPRWVCTHTAGMGLVTGTKFGTHTCTCSGCTPGVWAGREGQGESYTSNGTMCMMVCIVPLLL